MCNIYLNDYIRDKKYKTVFTMIHYDFKLD